MATRYQNERVSAARLAMELRKERVNHELVRTNLCSVITSLQRTSEQLLEQIAEMQTAYASLAALNLTMRGKQ